MLVIRTEPRFSQGPRGSRTELRRLVAWGALTCLLWLPVALLGSPPALASDVDSGGGRPEEFIVGFEPGVNHAEQEALLSDKGAHLEDVIRRGTVLVRATRDEVARLKSEEDVRFAEPNGTVRALAPLPPNDPQLWDLWGINRISAPAGWARTTKSTEVVVAVSDTGIWSEHEDLSSRLWRNPGEVADDNIDNDGNGVVDDIHGADLSNGGQSGRTTDGNGHGTHVAGTIGADAFNRLGVVGVSPYARLMNAQFMDANGYGQVGDAVRSIDYAVSKGARVINCSWGTTSYSEAIYEAIGRARAKGVLVVAAAGNYRADADVAPMYPAAYPSTNIISVAATTSSSTLASFSNYGKTSVDIGAPGQMIRSTIINGGSGYSSGTSMAAPHVSGIAAVLWGERPELSYWDIRRAILEGGSPLAELTDKTATGKLADLLGSLDYLSGIAEEPPPKEPPGRAPDPPAGPPSEPAPDRRPVLRETPAIQGSPKAPGNLYCSGGAWTGSDDTQVRWLRGEEVIGHGTLYTTGAADVGKPITCRGIAYNPFGSRSADSVPVQVVGSPPAPVPVSRPVIRKVNAKVLRCDKGQWSDATWFEYSWIMGKTTVGGTEKLNIKGRWRGLRVRCRVVAHGLEGTFGVAQSKGRKIARKAKT